MAVLLACLAAHGVLAQVVPSLWGVPDLALVGLVLATARDPERWLRFSCAAGGWMLLWAVRFPIPVFLSYLAVGWAVQMLALRWDVLDLRVQLLITGPACVVLTAAVLWLDALWSLPVLGLLAVRVAATVLTVPVVRWIAWGHYPTWR